MLIHTTRTKPEEKTFTGASTRICELFSSIVDGFDDSGRDTLGCEHLDLQTSADLRAHSDEATMMIGIMMILDWYFKNVDCSHTSRVVES
jgi:hypothetical protein